MSDDPQPAKKPKLFTNTELRNKTCVRCGKSFRKLGLRDIKIINDEADKEKIKILVEKDVYLGDVLCSKCRSAVSKKQSQQNKITNDKKEFKLGPTASTSSTVLATPSKRDDNNLEVINYTDPNTEAYNFFRQLSGLSLTPPTQPSPESPVNFASKEKVNIEKVELPFKRVTASHKYCCVCTTKASDKNKMIVVPLEARIQAFTVMRIFINKNNRCCHKHIIKKRFITNELVSTYNNFRVFSNVSNVEITELSMFLDKISLVSTMTIHEKIGKFFIAEDRLKLFTGYSYAQVETVTSMLHSLRKSINRDPLQAVVIFLLKLRTGSSDPFINAILEVKEHQCISNCFHSVIEAFEKDVLPTKFGVNSITRHNLITHHTSTLVKQLHDVGDDTLVLIHDGTYIYHQKSRNNEYQRKSYSGQKKASLCKPFTICCTDGYVYELPGPFYANQNDAQILKIILQDPNGISKVLKPGDIFILDRGFRDVVKYLTEKGYVVLMPALRGKRPRLTTVEANSSRLVTKVRWVVEVIHGIIGKKFKLLHNEIHNRTLPSIGSIARIACFLNNEFGKRLESDKGMSEEIIGMMKSRLNLENTLAMEIENEGWGRKKAIFTNITSNDLENFPELSIDELKLLFGGSYQLSQAVCYLGEIMDENDQLNVSHHKHRPNIIKFQVKSRHRNSKTYKCIIDYTPGLNCIEGIKRYACDCANGLRTVGCCCHIAAVIYYLSNARFESKTIRAAELLSHIFDAQELDDIVPVVSDSEESEGEDN